MGNENEEHPPVVRMIDGLRQPASFWKDPPAHMDADEAGVGQYSARHWKSRLPQPDAAPATPAAPQDSQKPATSSQQTTPTKS